MGEDCVVLNFPAFYIALKAFVSTHPSAFLGGAVPASVTEAVTAVLNAVLCELKLAVRLVDVAITGLAHGT